jgi:hypothetical protein
MVAEEGRTRLNTPLKHNALHAFNIDGCLIAMELICEILGSVVNNKRSSDAKTKTLCAFL